MLNVIVKGESFDLVEKEAILMIDSLGSDFVTFQSYDKESNLLWVKDSRGFDIRVTPDEITDVINEKGLSEKQEKSLNFLNTKFKEIQEKVTNGYKTYQTKDVVDKKEEVVIQDTITSITKANKQIVVNGKLKPDFTLLPQMALEEVALVMTKGEAKYADFNYSKGLELRTYLAAALRHINTSLLGVDIDDEMQQDHLACAAANLLMALDNKKNNKIIDNRNPYYENNNKV